MYSVYEGALPLKQNYRSEKASLEPLQNRSNYMEIYWKAEATGEIFFFTSQQPEAEVARFLRFYLSFSTMSPSSKISTTKKAKALCIQWVTWTILNTAWKVSLFEFILVRMRENTGQNNSKYGHFSRRGRVNTYNKSFLQTPDKIFLVQGTQTKFRAFLLSDWWKIKNKAKSSLCNLIYVYIYIYIYIYI